MLELLRHRKQGVCLGDERHNERIQGIQPEDRHTD